MRHHTASVLLASLALSLVFGISCAGPPRPRPEPPPRIKDSAPEKVAAQRASLTTLKLEGEDERWGIEAARERKQRAGRPDPAATTPPRGADLRKQAAPARP